MARNRKRAALAGLVFGATLAVAAVAEARSITVRWRFPAPERAAGFRVHVGAAPGAYTHTVDVGKPMPDAGGVYEASVEVPDTGSAFVAVSAYGERGEESPRSNEIVRTPSDASEPLPAAPAPELGTPGQPRVVRP